MTAFYSTHRRKPGSSSSAELISIDQWRHLELMRYLDQETGRHGYYGDEVTK
jgi:hypothetical protein